MNLLNAREVADIFGVKPVAVYAWAKAGKLPCVILSVGHRKDCVRFRPDSIQEWIESREKKVEDEGQRNVA